MVSGDHVTSTKTKTDSTTGSSWRSAERELTFTVDIRLVCAVRGSCKKESLLRNDPRPRRRQTLARSFPTIEHQVMPNDLSVQAELSGRGSGVDCVMCETWNFSDLRWWLNYRTPDSGLIDYELSPAPARSMMIVRKRPIFG